MTKIDVEERRARLGVRHHLARRGESVEQVSSDLVGLHSSDPATVFLSAWARVQDFAAPELEQVLYERRSLVRMLGMRRTLFVVPRELAAVMDAACTRDLAPAEGRRLIRLLEEQAIADDGETWLGHVARRTLDALAKRGESTATELTAEVPELAGRLSFGAGKTWAGTMGVSTRLLFLLATEGKIVRARPLGGWTSSQYRWALTRAWLGGDLREVAQPEARVVLLGRWLRTFGPGTLTDIKWWTGWTVRQTRSTLAELGAIEVELDEGPGYALPDDLDPTPAPEPWVALVPGLDPTVMGWKEREWYLGRLGPEVFDRNGNAGPTVWCNGGVIGGWGQAESGEVVVKLLESVDSEIEGMIEAEAARLSRWLGEVRIKPRFRTPLEKEMTGRIKGV